MLTACTSPQYQTQPLPAGIQPASSLAEWQVNGKIAMRNTNDAMTVRFDWQQTGEDYQLILSGSLGFGSVTVVKQGDQVSLWKGRVNSDKRTAQPAKAAAGSAEQLLAEQTGWHLPISHLRYWALGVPVPPMTAVTDNVSGAGEGGTVATSIAGFEQDQWQVSYPGSVMVGNYHLPKKMRAQQDDLHIIIAFSQWRPGESPAE